MTLDYLTIIAKIVFDNYLTKIKDGYIIDLPYYALLIEPNYYFIILYSYW